MTQWETHVNLPNAIKEGSKYLVIIAETKNQGALNFSRIQQQLRKNLCGLSRMFYTVGRYYKLFNRGEEISGRYKLIENHLTFLVFNGITIQKDLIAEDDMESMALEKANEDESLWVVESIDPQTPPRKTRRSKKSKKCKKSRAAKYRS
jgi:hypothetical protein